jgi:mRNA interferase RelE/StbE
MLQIEISRCAEKFVASLPPKHQRQIAVKLQELRGNPRPVDSVQLKSARTHRRADVGEYRIIYSVESETLRIDLIGKRNDSEVYRRFECGKP